MEQIITRNFDPLGEFRLGLKFNLQYPADLFAPKHGGNFMIFFINEQKDLVGANVKNPKIRRPFLKVNSSGETIPVSEERWTERIVMANRSSNVSRRVNQSTVTTGAIALYIPGNLVVQYSMNYEEPSLGFILGTLFADNSLQALGNIGKEALGSLVRDEALVSTIRNLAKNLESVRPYEQTFGETLEKAVYAKVGVAENPFKQIMFNGLGFRKFTFTFTMIPRNQRESTVINSIVEAFKYHMHPEEQIKETTGNFTSAGRFFVAPSDFDIEFYRIVKKSENSSKYDLDESTVFENHFLFAISTCVLTDMSVDYTPAPEGFISHHDGSPLGVKIQLNFTETEILTKRRIIELNKDKFLYQKQFNAEFTNTKTPPEW